MSVNVLGQNVTPTWSRIKPPDFSMLSLSHAHSEAYRAASNDLSDQSLIPSVSYHQHPSNSALSLPFNYHSYLNRDFGSGLSSHWNVLGLDGARKLEVPGQKVPVSIVTTQETQRTTPNKNPPPLIRVNPVREDSPKSKSRNTSNVSSKRTESKSQSSSRKDYAAKCQLSKSQMNGLPDKISMTGSGGPANADHLAWLADVASNNRGSANQRPSPREPSSPGHQSSSAGGLAHSADGSVIGSGSGSLFRPPIPSAPSTNDLYPAQFAMPGSAHLHHRNSMVSDNSLAAYYNHATPRYSPFYSPRYSPTGPYQSLSAQSSPGLVPQQFFPMDSFPGGLQQSGIEATGVPGGHHASHPSQSSSLQLPHSRNFAPHHNAHGSPQSSYPGGLAKLNSKLPSHFAGDTGGSLLYDERLSSLKDRVPSAANVKNISMDKKNQLLNPLTLKLSGKPLEPGPDNGLNPNRNELASGLRSGLQSGGSLKHRILRPSNIKITEPPSSVMAGAPLSAPPLRTTYQSDIPSPKYPRLSTPTSLTSARQRSPLPSIIKQPKDVGPPVPNFVPTTSDSKPSFGTLPVQFPAHFKKGSIIQLANNSLKRVEDLSTDDFLESTTLSPDLIMASSTVIRIQESPDCKTAILRFYVGVSKVNVTVETPIEHPFFVFGRGWSSCSPERSLHQYGLQCEKLKIGDVCVSLTNKNRSGSSASQSSPASSTTVTINVTGSSTRLLPAVAATKDETRNVSFRDRPKSSSTMPDKKADAALPKIPILSEAKTKEANPAQTSGTRKRRSSAPANINLEQMPLNKS